MGFLDYFKPKKKELDNTISKLMDEFFPKGEADIIAGTNELLFILNNKISKEDARMIFMKSVSVSRLSNKFDKERLVLHLKGYCIQHFSERQVNDFHFYLFSLSTAMKYHKKSTCEVRREDDKYLW